MNTYVAWIDREHAKIFQISAEKMERKIINTRKIDHHSHSPDNLDHQRQEHRLFLEVVPLLKDADQLLLLGPGVAKHHFQTYLLEHQPLLARKICGCETVDHPSDGQIAALARKYFKIGELAAASGDR